MANGVSSDDSPVETDPTIVDAFKIGQIGYKSDPKEANQSNFYRSKRCANITIYREIMHEILNILFKVS